jgi:hypothetical protein
MCLIRIYKSKKDKDSETDAIKRVKSYNISIPDGNPENIKLLRNRESARNSRKRKKIYIQLLENKVEELTKELDQKKTLVYENQKNLQNMCIQSKFVKIISFSFSSFFLR